MPVNIKELIVQGKALQDGLKYVPPVGLRTFRVYTLANFDDYYQWKESAIRFLHAYYLDDLDRFVKYSELFESKHYLPEHLSNMVGVLVACDAMPSEKQKEIDMEDSKGPEIKSVEELEQTYLGYRSYGSSIINSAGAIDAFHKWHAAACVLFDKWFYSTDEDLVKFQDIDSGGNGYVLSTEYNSIYSPYCKLMSRLKEGRDLKRAMRKAIPAKHSLAEGGEKKKVNIFISYAHTDAKWLEKLQNHLKVLKKYFDNIECWADTQLKGGDKWREEIEKAIEKANVAILLVSTDFLASDFISTDELPPLLRKAAESGTRILPLIVSPCDYEISELEEFQAINSPERTLADLAGDEASIDRVFLALTREIQALL